MDLFMDHISDIVFEHTSIADVRTQHWNVPIDTKLRPIIAAFFLFKTENAVFCLNN